jgi:Fasciclin domain
MTKMVGGAAMYPSKNIIQNALNSKDNTTLVAAVKAAGLVETLQGPGPFTVFAPTNAAFAQLPPGTVVSLLKPENKGQLTTVLTYHVLPGHLTTADLKNAVKDGGGQATFTTVQGEPLTSRALPDYVESRVRQCSDSKRWSMSLSKKSSNFFDKGHALNSLMNERKRAMGIATVALIERRERGLRVTEAARFA